MINLQNLHAAPPRKTWWQKYRSSLFIGLLFGTVARVALGTGLSTTEAGVFVLSFAIIYTVWLCCRHK